jgi:hypothetical protein
VEADQSRLAAVGFHRGELAVQRRADVQVQAARLAAMVARGQLRTGMAAFISAATFAAICARDKTGRLWISPIFERPGFLSVTSPTTLQVSVSVPDSEPLCGLPEGQPVGVIIMDLMARRRVRINGVLGVAGVDQLTIDVDQAYSNCPQYIQQRRLRIERPVDDRHERLYLGDTLRANDIRLIETADTFFLGTTHPASGNDASHRGRPPGFVRVTPEHLWWPDYPGNNLFNSFGNLAVDPAAALSFIDFRHGTSLQLSGDATVCWGDDPASTGDDADTGRRVYFSPRRVLAAAHAGADLSRPPY